LILGGALIGIVLVSIVEDLKDHEACWTVDHRLEELDYRLNLIWIYSSFEAQFDFTLKRIGSFVG